MPNDRAESLSETPDPGVKYTYTCIYCERTFTTYRTHVGSLRTICDECQPKAASLRVKKWRERHPDRAKEANRRTVEQRKAKKTGQDVDE